MLTTLLGISMKFGTIDAKAAFDGTSETIAKVKPEYYQGAMFFSKDSKIINTGTDPKVNIKKKDNNKWW